MTETKGYRERRYLCGDGLSLYYRDYGNPAGAKTPVLCLAGLTRNSKDFHGLAHRLSKDRRVLCPDYRGRGRSDYDPDWTRYHPRTYVDDVRHLLVAAGVHEVIVIGTSMGGIIAAALAVVIPGALRAVVLNDVGPDIDSEGLDRIVAYLRDTKPLPDWDAAAAHLKATLPHMPARNPAQWRMLAEGTYRQCEDGLLRAD
ncbi:alpha/beta hydrolase, partial [bacterium]|nr:alpha/beta hydrolase [bacterium]